MSAMRERVGADGLRSSSQSGHRADAEAVGGPAGAGGGGGEGGVGENEGIVGELRVVGGDAGSGEPGDDGDVGGDDAREVGACNVWGDDGRRSGSGLGEQEVGKAGGVVGVEEAPGTGGVALERLGECVAEVVPEAELLWGEDAEGVA